MNTEKVWELLTRPLDESDRVFLLGLECNFKLTETKKEPLHVYGRTYEYQSPVPAKLLVSTTTEKQESLLKLKYGDELILHHVYHSTHPDFL